MRHLFSILIFIVLFTLGAIAQEPAPAEAPNSGFSLPVRILEQPADPFKIEMDSKDLRAQQEMAQAAKSTVFLGWAQSIATSVSIMLLCLTLFFERKANKVAFDAANEAKRVGRAEATSYIQCSKAQVFVDNVSGVLTLVITVKNVGKTPAKKLNVRAILSFKTKPAIGEGIKQRPGVEGQNAKSIFIGTLGSGVEKEYDFEWRWHNGVEGGDFSAEQLTALEFQQSTIFDCWMTWDDVFKDPAKQHLILEDMGNRYGAFSSYNSHLDIKMDPPQPHVSAPST